MMNQPTKTILGLMPALLLVLSLGPITAGAQQQVEDLSDIVIGVSPLLYGPGLYQDEFNGFRIYVPDGWALEELMTEARNHPTDTPRQTLLELEDAVAQEERGYNWLIEICREDDTAPNTTYDLRAEECRTPDGGSLYVRKVFHLQDVSVLAGVASGEDLALEAVMAEQLGQETVDFVKEANQTMIALLDLSMIETQAMILGLDENSYELVNSTFTDINVVASDTNETIGKAPAMLKEARYSDALSRISDADFTASAILMTVKEDIIDEETGEVDLTGFIVSIGVPSHDRETLGRPDILFRLPDQKQMFESFELLVTEPSDAEARSQ